MNQGFWAALSLVSVTAFSAPALPNGSPPDGGQAASWAQAKKVFDSRCIVCHACFDAPCQLKLDSFEGIERGANPARVYASRLLAADPTRLFVDAHGATAWRKRGFHGVVPEGGTAPQQSVVLQLLALKRAHPLTPDVDVAANFTLELDRKESCVKDDGVAAWGKAHPLWGMPYGLPGLSEGEEHALASWIEAGMPHPAPAPLPPALQESVRTWETFLNDASLRGRLVARYLFEHLYFASLYFKGADDETFFTLVRSRTPPGEAVDEIATRRPYDDPGVPLVFYRLVHREGHPLDKTHIPYPLGAARLARYRELFFGPDTVVTSWPGYSAPVAANPFRAFAAIPVDARYRFLLDDAEFTLRGFVKGPVCRGNVALNVIQDRFWVMFIRPDSAWMREQASFLTTHADLLDLPAEGGSNPPPLQWMHASADQKRTLRMKAEGLQRLAASGDGVSSSTIWDGDGKNPNAALTVFRHYDHGTVVAGLIGELPQTGFVLDYMVLERISYLLVSGFDVFGAVSHQLQTRMYMDHLRMEAEYNWLALLPSARRGALVAAWYRGLNPLMKASVEATFAPSPGEPQIGYGTPEPERELLASLQRRLAPITSHRFDTRTERDAELREALTALGVVRGEAAALMPELSFVRVTGGAHGERWFSVTRDSAHSNVAQVFDEDKRRLPAEDRLTAVPGLLGAYPEAFFTVPRKDLGRFAAGACATPS